MSHVSLTHRLQVKLARISNVQVLGQIFCNLVRQINSKQKYHSEQDEKRRGKYGNKRKYVEKMQVQVPGLIIAMLGASAICAK
jgi:hypothetical protein